MISLFKGFLGISKKKKRKRKNSQPVIEAEQPKEKTFFEGEYLVIGGNSSQKKESQLIEENPPVPLPTPNPEPAPIETPPIEEGGEVDPLSLSLPPVETLRPRRNARLHRQPETLQNRPQEGFPSLAPQNQNQGRSEHSGDHHHTHHPPHHVHHTPHTHKLPTAPETKSKKPLELIKHRKVKEGHFICPICLGEESKTSPQAAFLECLHWYHYECIHDWFKKQKSCPVCQHKCDHVYLAVE